MKMRLAFREEGNLWCAYAATIDTMVSAVLLGSIALSLVHDDKAIKQAFMDLMKQCFSNTLAAATGQRSVSWNDEVPAPEHERSRS